MPLICLSLLRAVTVTFTTAGVTCEATVSMARSRASKALTLSSLNAGAAGAADAAVAVGGLRILYAANDPTRLRANRGARSRRGEARFLLLIGFLFLSFSSRLDLIN